MIYQCENPYLVISKSPKRVKCKCGWFNDQPSKAKENIIRCQKCGVLVNDKARFKAGVIKILKGRKYENN